MGSNLTAKEAEQGGRSRGRANAAPPWAQPGGAVRALARPRGQRALLIGAGASAAEMRLLGVLKIKEKHR